MKKRKETHIMPRAIAIGLIAALIIPTAVAGNGERRGGKGRDREEATDIKHARSRDDLRRAIQKRMIEKFMKEVKEKSPEKYEQMMQMHKDSPEKFMQLVRGAIIKRKDGEGRPDEPRRPEPPNGYGPRRGRPDGHGGQKHRFSERFIENLREKRPEAFEHLLRLRKENPEAAQKEIRKLYGGFKQKHFLPDERIPKLIAAIRSAKDNEAGEAAKAQLKTALNEAFEARLKAKEDGLNRLSEKLEEMRKQLAEYRKRKTEMCDKRYQQILEDIENFKGPGQEGEWQRKKGEHKDREKPEKREKDKREDPYKGRIAPGTRIGPRAH